MTHIQFDVPHPTREGQTHTHTIFENFAVRPHPDHDNDCTVIAPRKGPGIRVQGACENVVKEIIDNPDRPIEGNLWQSAEDERKRAPKLPFYIDDVWWVTGVSRDECIVGNAFTQRRVKRPAEDVIADIKKQRTPAKAPAPATPKK